MSLLVKPRTAAFTADGSKTVLTTARSVRWDDEKPKSSSRSSPSKKSHAYRSSIRSTADPLMDPDLMSGADTMFTAHYRMQWPHVDIRVAPKTVAPTHAQLESTFRDPSVSDTESVQETASFASCCGRVSLTWQLNLRIQPTIKTVRRGPRRSGPAPRLL